MTDNLNNFHIKDPAPANALRVTGWRDLPNNVELLGECGESTLKTHKIPINHLRRVHGLSEAAARLIAALHFGEAV